MQSRFLNFIPSEDIQSFNSGNACRAWRCFGCIFIPRLNMHRFVLWAPNAKAVSLIPGADGNSLPMEKAASGGTN